MKKFNADTKVVLLATIQDASGAAELSDFVSMAKYDSLMVLYTSDVGTAGEDVTVKLQQAKDNAATDVKDLDRGTWYVSQNATFANLTDTFTDDTATGGGEFEDDGETICIARIEVTADQLDDGFGFVRVSVDNSGTTAGKAFTLIGVMRGARYAVDVPDQPSVLS